MDVWRITVAALRRWYVLFPLLALTGFAAYQAGQGIAPEYQATSTVMYVVGPAETELPNPYGNLTGANEVVGIVLNSVETHRAIAEAGHEGAYQVAPRSRSSIASISIRSDDYDDAVATGAAVIEAAEQELLERQTAARIPPAAQVKLEVLEAPTVVAAVQNGKLRIQAAVGVVGASIALLVAVLFDDISGLLRRGRNGARRRGGRGGRIRRELSPPDEARASETPEAPDAPDEPESPDQPELFAPPQLEDDPQDVRHPDVVRSLEDYELKQSNDDLHSSRHEYYGSETAHRP